MCALATEVRSLPQSEARQRKLEQSSQLELSVVVPVYQERDVIRDVIVRLVQVLDQMGLRYEIIVVDDGSRDGTEEVLQELGVQFSDHLRVIAHPYNKGLGAALKTGIRAAQGETIAWMDGDGQHDPRDLPRMFPHVREYDLVVGARTRDYRAPWHRNLANSLYNSLASWLAEFPIEDLTSGYRLFRASAIKKYVHLLPARFSSATTSTLALIKGGYNIKYVPANVSERRSGRSKVRIVRDGWRFLVIITKIVAVFEPLRVFLPIALLSFIFATLSTIYSMWSESRLLVPNSAVLLFVLSVLVLLLGLIAEQIAVLQVSSKGGTEVSPDEGRSRSDIGKRNG